MAHDAHGEKAMARSRSNWEKELASIDKTLLDLLNRRARFCHQTHPLGKEVSACKKKEGEKKRRREVQTQRLKN